MKRRGTILVLFSMLALCLQGCGDKVEGDARTKWAAFQTEQIAAIQAGYAEQELKPYGFENEIVRVKDLPHKFEGLIRFKRGNVLQEQSYAFIHGSWKPLEYASPEDKKAAKERQQKIERLEREINELKGEIEKEEEALIAYKARLESLKAKKTEVQKLQAALEELKGNR
jgi:DNA repair exonuclease SbcCD ATPase subunit